MQAGDSVTLPPDLAVAANDIFEGGQLLRADRPPGVELAGGDPDLRAEAELAAVRKLRGGVPNDDRAVDLVHEALGGRCVFGDNRLGVTGAVSGNVADGFVHAVDGPDGENRREIFGAPIILRGRLHRHDLPRRLIAAELSAIESRGDDGKQ